MYLGRVVEKGTAHQIFKDPQHPYTERLLKSIPKMGQKSKEPLDVIEGTVPIPLDPPAECGFFSRCPAAMVGKCDRQIPALVEHGSHQVRCFLHSEDAEQPFEADEKLLKIKRRRPAGETADATEGGSM